MWKPWQQKTPTPNSTSPGEDLEQAAAETTAIPPSPKPEPEPVQNRPGFFARLFNRTAPTEERFLIKPEWARATVKVCFFPLAQFHHPAWEVTDEEAEKAAPEMQAFLQIVFDKYAPAILTRLSVRNPELLDLCLAMSWLAWTKYQLVAEQIEAAELLGKNPPSRVVPISGEARPAQESVEELEPVTCEKCGVEFASRKKCAEHLPCPGKKEPVN